MDLTTIITLRNLSLGLHANAGLMITVPTDAAISGQIDEEGIKTAMSAYLDLILNQVGYIYYTMGITPPFTKTNGNAAIDEQPEY